MKFFTSLLSQQLDCFHMISLRSTLSIKWQDRVANLKALDQAEVISIEAMILQSQLRWVGHVIRMDDHRLLKQLLKGELSSGKRNKGRPRKRLRTQRRRTSFMLTYPKEAQEWSFKQTSLAFRHPTNPNQRLGTTFGEPSWRPERGGTPHHHNL